MANSPKPKTWRQVLLVHPAAELFPRMSESELRELGEDIRANKLQFPIATWFDPEAKVELLIDGRNRLDAMELVGLPTAEVISYRSRLTCIDPWAFVVAANIKRRHLTSEQKRDVIAALLKAKPEQSDRTIAKQTKVDHKTVGKTRKTLQSRGEIPHVEKRTDTKGREQPSTKPKKTPKSVSPPKTNPIGSSPVRYSEVPATSVPRLSATADFLINDISRQLKEADGKLSAHDRTEVSTRIRALVDPDDIVGETLRLVEKMTPAQRRDFIARLEIDEQRKSKHAAVDEITDDLSIPAFMQRRPS